MSDLRDRIAAALYQWTLAAAGGGMSRPPNETALRENSLARADAVMGTVGPEIAERDAALDRVRALADEWTDITIGPVTLDRDKWLAIAGENIRHVLDDGRGQSTTERLARVRELHASDDDSEDAFCDHCRVPYPCPTIRTIDGSTDE